MTDEELDRQEALARQVLILAVLAKRVDEASVAVRRELAGMIRPGTTLKPSLGDGRPGGTVSYTQGGAEIRAEVSDEQAFQQWALKRYAAQCRVSIEVHPEFITQVLADSEAAGVPIGPGGEVGPDGPQGITFIERTKGAHLVARPDRKRAGVLWQTVRAEAIGIAEELTP